MIRAAILASGPSLDAATAARLKPCGLVLAVNDAARRVRHRLPNINITAHVLFEAEAITAYKPAIAGSVRACCPVITRRQCARLIAPIVPPHLRLLIDAPMVRPDKWSPPSIPATAPVGCVALILALVGSSIFEAATKIDLYGLDGSPHHDIAQVPWLAAIREKFSGIKITPAKP